ncbi:hypothetical protein D9615_002445 [Tricholomella constricta]|uniref:Uncharacterized protein n=1 Tax=Tricholomella constricta TaxID=117010 RepID=A0A8H5HMA5_9AGAR|nr:hypothetical protein D9615_002445 [Tricholomella constricta]
MNSTPGHVSISGIALLQEPRALDPSKGQRHLVFDATFCVIEGTGSGTVGLFRYFTSDDMAAKIMNMPDFQKAFVVANISSVTPKKIPAAIIQEDQDIGEYAFLGDVQQLFLIDDSSVNTNVNPYVTIAGTVTSFNAGDHTFTMSLSQYAALTHDAPVFPIHAHFTDPEFKKRWGTNGPKVIVGSILAFGGHMNRVVRERNIDRSLSFVEIEVVNISYLSNRGDSITSRTRSTGRRLGYRKRWNYNNLPDDLPESSTSKEKRKREEESEEDLEHKRGKTVSDDDEEDIQKATEN